MPVCAGFKNSGAPSCARQEKSGAQPLRAQAPAPLSSQCPLARCTCRRCFECLAGWLGWRIDCRQCGLATRSPTREGSGFPLQVAHFDAPGEHSPSPCAALGIPASASFAAPACPHSQPSSAPSQVAIRVFFAFRLLTFLYVHNDNPPSSPCRVENAPNKQLKPQLELYMY